MRSGELTCGVLSMFISLSLAGCLKVDQPSPPAKTNAEPQVGESPEAKPKPSRAPPGERVLHS